MAVNKGNYARTNYILFLLLWTTKYCAGNNELNNNEENNATDIERKQFCDNQGVWHEKLQRCSCTLGWIGTRCNVWHNHRCYFDNGQNYRGQLRVTNSGTICKSWTTIDNSRFELGKKGIGIHNFCRNPDNDEKGLWCYVHGEDLIGYCNATRCPDTVRDLLSVNATEIGTEDESSAAVQFVFGPLISGVCAGVVALLGFIAIAEYLRRRRFWARKRKREMQKELEESGKKDGDGLKEEKEESEEKQRSDKNEKQQVQKLGGVITVNVDTGKKKYWDASAKCFSNAAARLEPIDQSGELFVSTDPSMQCFSSAYEGEFGPPPPYKLRISRDTESPNEMKDGSTSQAEDRPMKNRRDSNTEFQQVDELDRPMTSTSNKIKRRKHKRNVHSSSTNVEEDIASSSSVQLPTTKELAPALNRDQSLPGQKLENFEEDVIYTSEEPATAEFSAESTQRPKKTRRKPQEHGIENSTGCLDNKTKVRRKKRKNDARSSSIEAQKFDDCQKSVRDLTKMFEKEQNSSLDTVQENSKQKNLRKKQRKEICIGVTGKNKLAEPTTFL